MGREVLVTGGSGGIGFAIAQAFADSGDAVTITGRDHDRLQAAGERIGSRVAVVDAGDPEDIASLPGLFPVGIDVIVNNAGGFVGSAATATSSVLDHQRHWLATLKTNLLGAVLTVISLEEKLRRGGSVVSIGSIGAEYAANAYSTAKAGLAAWNAGVSERLGARDITANIVSPGFIDGTDLFGGRMSDDRRARLVDRTHVKRAGRPADVAALVTFLASEQARHITGQTLHLNGGAHTTR